VHVSRSAATPCLIIVLVITVITGQQLLLLARKLQQPYCGARLATRQKKHRCMQRAPPASPYCENASCKGMAQLMPRRF